VELPCLVKRFATPGGYTQDDFVPEAAMTMMLVPLIRSSSTFINHVSESIELGKWDSS